jgi:hypothetical protein
VARPSFSEGAPRVARPRDRDAAFATAARLRAPVSTPHRHRPSDQWFNQSKHWLNHFTIAIHHANMIRLAQRLDATECAVTERLDDGTHH